MLQQDYRKDLGNMNTKIQQLNPQNQNRFRKLLGTQEFKKPKVISKINNYKTKEKRCQKKLN